MIYIFCLFIFGLSLLGIFFLNFYCIYLFCKDKIKEGISLLIFILTGYLLYIFIKILEADSQISFFSLIVGHIPYHGFGKIIIAIIFIIIGSVVGLFYSWAINHRNQLKLSRFLLFAFLFLSLMHSVLIDFFLQILNSLTNQQNIDGHIYSSVGFVLGAMTSFALKFSSIDSKDIEQSQCH